ncbi:protein PLASTID MOVEMENT IMPAIRED 1-RELATED 1-like [Lycium barbarum]|uniref:protein PLASTID MOVEMENT IMPAIRED 1-RELATED 1-like n=1 Tax=Lycium barbarum TaxID=112863 RepID=UPI00293E0417|nr:protein PLASTID MOVEMENT IMPAIRED 1-RELATED 1-like [Lycium barbarum]
MSWKSSSGNQNGGRLLCDIEEISKALYVHKTPRKALTFQADHGHDSVGDTHVFKSGSNVVAGDMLRKQKKSSIWSWKPLKVLTHIRHRRFNCCFFLHVHGIEGLPVNFKDLALCVNWKRKGEVMRTRPAQVCQGTAEFEETLMHSSSVYGSRTGHQHSAKYEPKHFLLYVSVIGAPALDIGKHLVDLTRLLPLTMEELEEGRNSGKWTTSFKLSGKAKGAILNVSFGFSVSGSNSIEPSQFMQGIEPAATDHSSECDGASANTSLRRVGSVPRKPGGTTHSSSRSLDARNFDEVLSGRKSELSRSITLLYRKLEEGKLDKLDDLDFFFEYLEPLKPNSGVLSQFSAENTMDDQHIEFSISELGTESSQLKPEVCSYESCDDTPIETTDVAYILEERSEEKSEYNQKHESNDVYRGEDMMKTSNYEETDMCKDEMFEELESVFLDLLTAESAELDSPVEMYDSIDQESYMNLKSSYESSRRVKSLSIDDVANDFLDMLNIEQTSADLSSDTSVDSPRESLLRQFEKETFPSGNSIFDFDATDDQVEFSGIASSIHGRVACSDDFDLSSVVKDFEEEHKKGTQSLRSKRNAKMIENLETEVLMQDWGLNEKAFQNSPRISSGGFGSPIYLSPERPLQLPLLPLGEGLGSEMCTRNGGFLHSMSPQLFRNARNGARLIMQFSSPVVLPAAMGCSVMEILSCWASGGISKMSVQADTLMPLEDITGRNIQEMASEAVSRLEPDVRFTFWHGLFGMKKDSEDLLFHQSSGHLNSTSIVDGVDLGFVFMEDLAPLAMDKIEPLTIEGLRIQSNLSDNEAPSSIRPQFSEVFGSNTAGALQHWSGKESDDVEGDLVELSVSPDEWLRLDAGDFSNNTENKERITKILAAHHAKSLDLDSSGLETGEERSELLGRECGILCNKLTLALRVQLRDPLRDYEMVGISMLILIQLERSCAPVEQYTERNSSSENDPKEQFIQEEIIAGESERGIHRQAVSQFKITEIHVAGFNSGPKDDQIWGRKRQQQAGSRWLLSSGMGRTSKRPLSKSNAIIRSSSQIRRNMQPGDVLWSISSDFHTRDSKSNVHIRNSDIIFPTEGCPNPSQLGIKL